MKIPFKVSCRKKGSLEVLLSLMAFLFITACSEDVLDTITLKVISDKAIVGVYSKNNDPFQDLSPTNLQGGFYVFEKDFDDCDHIEVLATRPTVDDLLIIRIYREDTKVKEDLLDSNDTNTTTLIFEYEYGEEENL